MADEKLKEIIITVDTNDGDYITEISSISESDLEKIMPLLKEIANFKPYTVNGMYFSHNYPEDECLRDDIGEKSVNEIYSVEEDVHDLFNNFLPHPEYGFHTIISVEVGPKVTRDRLV